MRVLYLAHRIPDAPTKGDKIRAYHQIGALAARHEVHVRALDDDPASSRPPDWRDRVASCKVFPLRPLAARCRSLRALIAGGSISAAHFAEPALRRELDAELTAARFDLAVVYSGAMDPLVRGFRPRLLDLVDVDSAKFRAYHQQRTVGGFRRFVFGVEGRRLERLEAEASFQADATVLCTNAEAQELQKFARPRRLEVIGNGVDCDAIPYRDDAARVSGRIVFIGALDYPANVDAVRHLTFDLLPAILAQFPGAHLHLVGRNPVPEVRELGDRPGVTVIANAPEVLSHLHAAAVTVLPFRIARGIQNKALEAFAAGLPVVMSTLTAQGLAGLAGEDYWTAPDADELVSRTVALLRDPRQGRALAARARRLVEREYSWAGMDERFVALAEEMAAGANGSE